MLRAKTIVRKPAVKPDQVVDTVFLDHRQRQRNGIVLRGERGREFTLDLDKPSTLNDGDAVKLEDGGLIQVAAAPQKLLEVRAENPVRLLRLAWQAGSRHVAIEVIANAVFVEDTPAIAELVRGLGCVATPVTRPFKPEQTAHFHDHDGHGHDHHHHAHGHGHHHHEHGHDHHHHGHGHDHHGHTHGHGGGDGHSHDH